MVTCQNNNSVYFSPNEKYFSLHEKYLDTRPRCRNQKELHVWWHVFSNGQKHSFTLSITPGDVGEEKWMSCRAQILMTGNICIINPLLWHTLNTTRATTTSALHCWNWFCNTASQTVESSQIVSTRDGLFLSFFTMKYWEIGTQMPLYTSNQLMADNISFWKLGIKSDRHSDCNCKRMSKKLIEIYYRQLQIKDTENTRKIWRL